MILTYNNLGNSELRVSNVCLGTMTFGEQTSEDEAFKILDFAYSSGINFIDTAEMYPIYPKAVTQGSTEKIIGKWMADRKVRDKIILATKICSSHPKGIGATELRWIRGGGKNLRLDKKNFELAVNDSLQRLKTDFIDLYQLHWPERNVPIFGNLDFEYDPNEAGWTPIEEILDILQELKKKGKIRHYGLSNESAWGFAKFLHLAEKYNYTKPVSIQNGYNLINRVFDISNSEIALRENCGLLAYSPLAGGRLSGKYINKNKPENARYTLWPQRFSRHNTARGESAIKKYFELSKKFGIDLSCLAHAFVLKRPFVTSSIFGVTNLNQLKHNLKSTEAILPREIIDEINKIHYQDPNPCV